VSVFPFDLLVALTLLPAVIAVLVASANFVLAVFLLLVAELAAESSRQTTLASVTVPIPVRAVLGNGISGWSSWAGVVCNWRCNSECANSTLVAAMKNQN